MCTTDTLYPLLAPSPADAGGELRCGEAAVRASCEQRRRAGMAERTRTMSTPPAPVPLEVGAVRSARTSPRWASMTAKPRTCAAASGADVANALSGRLPVSAASAAASDAAAVDADDSPCAAARAALFAHASTSPTSLGSTVEYRSPQHHAKGAKHASIWVSSSTAQTGPFGTPLFSVAQSGP
jgi:hypothetical protein